MSIAPATDESHPMNARIMMFLRGGIMNIRTTSMHLMAASLLLTIALSFVAVDAPAATSDWSDDSAIIAWKSDRNSIQVYGPDNHCIWKRSFAADVEQLALSPDGTTLIFSLRFDGVWFVEVQSGNTHRIQQLSSGEFTTSLEWSPDGRHFLASILSGSDSKKRSRLLKFDAKGENPVELKP